jgi:hypothetical protein
MTIMLNRLSKKTAAFQAVALVLVLCTASSAFANTWQNVNSIAGGFAVEMPGAPERTVKTVDLSGKPTPMHNFLFATGNESYYVTYSDFPFSVTAAQLLTDVRNGQVGTGRVFSETSISVNGRPGKHFVFAEGRPAFCQPNRDRQSARLSGDLRHNSSQISQAGFGFREFVPRDALKQVQPPARFRQPRNEASSFVSGATLLAKIILYAAQK